MVLDRFKPMPCMLHLYVEEVDSVYKQAIQAGRESLHEPLNEFYDDRSAGIKDAWGNHWWITNHIEDVIDETSERKIQKRESLVTCGFPDILPDEKLKGIPTSGIFFCKDLDMNSATNFSGMVI